MQAWSNDQIATLQQRALTIARREGAADPESIAQEGLVALTKRYTPDEIESEDKSAPLHKIVKRLIAKSGSRFSEVSFDENKHDCAALSYSETPKHEMVDAHIELSREEARKRFEGIFGIPFAEEHERQLESLLRDARQEAASLEAAEKAFGSLWIAWAEVLSVVTNHSCNNAPAEAMRELVEDSLEAWKRIVARVCGETSVETACDLRDVMQTVEKPRTAWVPLPHTPLYFFVWLIDRTWTLPWPKPHSPLTNLEVATLLILAGHRPSFEEAPEKDWEAFERLARDVGRARKKYPTDPEDCADQVGLASPEP